MSQSGDERNGNITLLRGGQWGSWRASRSGGKRLRLRMPLDVERELDTAMHYAFIQVEGADGAVPSRGVQDVRELRARPWRTLARRFLEMRAAGCTLEQALAVLHAFERWLIRLWGTSNRAA